MKRRKIIGHPRIMLTRFSVVQKANKHSDNVVLRLVGLITLQHNRQKEDISSDEFIGRPRIWLNSTRVKCGLTSYEELPPALYHTLLWPPATNIPPVIFLIKRSTFIQTFGFEISKSDQCRGEIHLGNDNKHQCYIAIEEQLISSLLSS